MHASAVLGRALRERVRGGVLARAGLHVELQARDAELAAADRALQRLRLIRRAIPAPRQQQYKVQHAEPQCSSPALNS